MQRTFHDEIARRQSDIIPLAVPEDQDDTTFVFSFPRKNRDIMKTSAAFMAEEGPESEPQFSSEPRQSLPELDLQYLSGGAAVAAAKAESGPTKSQSKAKKVKKAFPA